MTQKDQEGMTSPKSSSSSETSSSISSADAEINDRIRHDPAYQVPCPTCGKYEWENCEHWIGDPAERLTRDPGERRATVYLVPNGAIADPNAPTVAELNAIVARAQPAKWAGVAE